MNDAVADKAGGISGIVIGGVAQIDVGTTKQIDVLGLYIPLRDIGTQLPIELLNIRNILQEWTDNR